MNSEQFTTALDGISDGLIDAAAGAYDKKAGKKRVLTRVLRVACAALVVTTLLFGFFGLAGGDPEIITAPGILKVYAYDTANGTNVEDMLQGEITDVVSSSSPMWSPVINVVCNGIPLVFQMPENYYDDAVITYDIRVEHGEFFVSNDNYDVKNPGEEEPYLYLGNEITIGNGKQIYWDGMDIWKIGEAVRDGGLFFADVVIRVDRKVAGYGVITLSYHGAPTPVCSIVRFVTVCFPMINHRLQEVSEENVRQEIVKVKEEQRCLTLGGVFDVSKESGEPVYAPDADRASGLRYYGQALNDRYAGKPITFEYSVNYGEFWDGEINLGSNITVSNGKTIWWRATGEKSLEKAFAEDGGIYAEVIIRMDGKIAGFALIKIANIGDAAPAFTTAECEMVWFPLVDGELEEIMEEYVRDQLAAKRD